MVRETLSRPVGHPPRAGSRSSSASSTRTTTSPAPAALRGWLAESRLAVDDAAVGEPLLLRMIDVREGLRGLALANNGVPADLRTLAGVVEVRLTPTGPVFAGDPPGLLLGLAAAAMLDGTWPRLKACPGDDCGWAFYDASRNRTGRWCSMAVCGSRAKARAYYRRHA